MSHRWPLIVVALICMFNGLYHPDFSYALRLTMMVAPGANFFGFEGSQWVAQAFIAMLTFLLGMIPAALYEKLRKLRRSDGISLAIWLVSTALLTLPSLRQHFPALSDIGQISPFL